MRSDLSGAGLIVQGGDDSYDNVEFVTWSS